MTLARRDPGNAKAIRLADAVAAIRAHLCAILDTELVDLSEARGRVLAGDLVAKVSLPHWDNAAADGFAWRGPDLPLGRPNRLTMVGEAAAGHPFGGIVGLGQAVRIRTGAPHPEGADLVVMQEVCRVDGSCLFIHGDKAAGKTWPEHWGARSFRFAGGHASGCSRPGTSFASRERRWRAVRSGMQTVASREACSSTRAAR